MAKTPLPLVCLVPGGVPVFHPVGTQSIGPTSGLFLHMQWLQASVCILVRC
ncbi:uncharacterized protein TRAVEDRAFT_42532 [Trametes versicolor FP-101664 SS1]|uniref:uncharacterized protein n=1 Tax=Trametes versicolor (strain FP-101664) TaxID=717944 RepID=UPI00046228C2|nr:uncharacterized protein TRAVEDRAFT_42532 [Trametes versicolor FP-101664 SS1]EIW65152.1 hypothetical protein TRAVEDRAFT_42532 [Trametes versicolor FP-101664 SS1]